MSVGLCHPWLCQHAGPADRSPNDQERVHLVDPIDRGATVGDLTEEVDDIGCVDIG